MRKTFEGVLAFLGCAVVGLVVTLTLAGIGQSGVTGMQITRALFLVAFALSIIAAPMAGWLFLQSRKDAVIAFLATIIIVGSTLLWLDHWLNGELAKQAAALNQFPAAIHTSAPPPSIPIIKTPQPPAPKAVLPKSQQDNSVHLGNGSNIEQHSSGNCSPNIVGGVNTVICAQKPPQLTWEAAPQVGDSSVLMVTVVGDSSIEFPAFLFVCDRPCNSSGGSVPGYSKSDNLFIYGHDNMTGVLFEGPRPLGQGVKATCAISQRMPRRRMLRLCACLSRLRFRSNFGRMYAALLVPCIRGCQSECVSASWSRNSA